MMWAGHIAWPHDAVALRFSTHYGAVYGGHLCHDFVVRNCLVFDLGNLDAVAGGNSLQKVTATASHELNVWPVLGFLAPAAGLGDRDT